MSVGQPLLLPNSIPPVRAGAADLVLQVFHSTSILFSFSPSYERVTREGLGICDLATFSFAYRAEKPSVCPIEHRILGVALGFRPLTCLVLTCLQHLLCKHDHPLFLALKSCYEQFPMQNWQHMKIASSKKDLFEKNSMTYDMDK